MKTFVAVFFVLYLFRFGLRIGYSIMTKFPIERKPITAKEYAFSIFCTGAVAVWAGLALLYP